MAAGLMMVGVDMGTTGCRACVVSDAGTLVAEASVSYEPERPRPGWAEQDPTVWWKAFRHAVGAVAGQAKHANLRAVALSSQSTALLPADKLFTCLRKAIIWQDTRATAECREIAERFGEDHVRDVTGWKPSTFLVWPKVLWFMQREPELFEKTRWLLQVNGHIIHRLCGEIVLDQANAVGYPKNVRTLDWDPAMCRWKDFPVERVPRIVPSTAVVGELSRMSAEMCGLPPDLPIVAGGMDTACAALAIGAIQAGSAFEVSGTSGGIGVISEEPSGARVLGVAPHVFTGRFINHAPMSAAGASLAWCRDVIGFTGGDAAEAKAASAYQAMEDEAAALGDGPTGLLFLPYMAGERAPVWDPEARGAMLGLTLSTRRAEMVKAVMEGVAYALRQNVDLVEQSGLAVGELRSCGGGSQSAAWSQIKADVTGKPIVVFKRERDAAFGAALLAGIGAGCWSAQQAEEALDSESPMIYVPRDDVTARYAPYQAAYERIYAHLKTLLPRP